MEDANRKSLTTLTADDYVAANRAFARVVYRRPTTRLFWIIFVCAFIGLLIWRRQLEAQGFPANVCIGALATLMILPFVMYFFVLPRNSRRAYAQQKTLHTPIEISWSDKGYRTVNDRGDWTIPWSDFLQSSESNDVFLLFQGPRLFNIVPKRALSQDQIDDLRCVIATNVR